MEESERSINDPRDPLVNTATAIAELIRHNAIQFENGFCWLKHAIVPGTTRRALVPVDFDLEYGQLGIVLFFCVLGEAGQAERWKACSRQALQPIARALERDGYSGEFLEKHDVRALVGACRSLNLIGRLLGNDPLVVRAEKRAREALARRVEAISRQTGVWEVTRSSPHVSIWESAATSRTSLHRARLKMERIRTRSLPAESVLGRGLAGLLYRMLQTSFIYPDEEGLLCIRAAASELVRRFRTQTLGGFLSDPRLLNYSPCLVDGLSGIGLVLILAARCPNALTPWRRS